MGLINFVKRAFGANNEITLTTCVTDAENILSYKTLADEASKNLIANTLSRVEFQTFIKGKEYKKDNYYFLNIQANKNQSSTLFWKEVIDKLLREGEALIIMQGEELFLADSFKRKEYAFKENVYSDIKIKDYPLNDIWTESKVLYLKNDSSKMQAALSGIYKEYSKLIQSSNNGYQNSKTRKGKLKIPTNLPKTLQEEGALQKHVRDTMKDFMDPSKNAVYPESNGFEYTEISDAKGSKSNDSGRETRNFIDDIFSFTAISRGIPPSLLKGDTVDTKDAVNNLMMFCINYYAKLVSDEINRKMYSKQDYLDNTYVKLDTTNLKVVDVRDIANSLELLTRTGSNTIDDNLRALGREPIGGDVGKMRFVTKNLDTVENVLKEGKTGDAKGGD